MSEHKMLLFHRDKSLVMKIINEKTGDEAEAVMSIAQAKHFQVCLRNAIDSLVEEISEK